MIKTIIFYSTKAKELIEKSPQKALVPYTQLAHLARNIKSNSKEAGHAVSHLDIYLQQCVDALWEDMKNRLTKLVCKFFDYFIIYYHYFIKVFHLQT